MKENGKNSSRLLVLLNVRSGFLQTEIAIGVEALLIAHTEAIAAVPEQVSPPRVNFSGSPGTRRLLSQSTAVLILDELVAPLRRRFLEEEDGRTRENNEINQFQNSLFVIAGSLLKPKYNKHEFQECPAPR